MSGYSLGSIRERLFYEADNGNCESVVYSFTQAARPPMAHWVVWQDKRIRKE